MRLNSYLMDQNFDELAGILTKLIDKLLKEPVNYEKKISVFNAPEILQEKIDFSLKNQPLEAFQLKELIEKVIENSVVFNHPNFMTQMFGNVQPIAFVADLIISFLNTSIYTYEVAPVMTMIEKEVIKVLSKKIWSDEGDGVFTSGGSQSNMNALFLARQQAYQSSKKKGLFKELEPAIFISEQAHYSFIKGVNYLGLGTDSLHLIPSDENAKVIIPELNKSIENAKATGKLPMMLIGIAGTTISGSFDNLEALSAIAKENNMWFHVDAAYGGSFLFSNQLKTKLKGIEHADSVSWNFHKMMGMPLSTASFLTRKKGVLNQAFHVSADYLFHDEDNDFNLGQKSLQGGRRPEAFKLWLSWKYLGEKKFEKHVEKLHKNARLLSHIIEAEKELELFTSPESAIVCFRYIPQNSNLSLAHLNQLNIDIREHIFNEGNMLFNYSKLHGKIYLRSVIQYPDLPEAQLRKMVSKIIRTAHQLETKLLSGSVTK